MEPGESLEAAVRREVLEETGVIVGAEISYAGSQPWPLPASLMLGFYAKATGFDIEVDADEIAEAKWFTRDDVRALVEAGTMVRDSSETPLLPNCPWNGFQWNSPPPFRPPQTSVPLICPPKLRPYSAL